MLARFDENPAMTRQVIKETKRYGRTHARTDNMKTVYPLQTKFAGGIIMVLYLVQHMLHQIKALQFYTDLGLLEMVKFKDFFYFPSADSFKKGCCQLQAKVCAQITGLPLAQACPGKSVVSELTVPQ